MKYAFYSAKAAAIYGAAVWARADGTQVEVTLIADEPECDSYMWDDKVCLGPVETVVSYGPKSSLFVDDWKPEFPSYKASLLKNIVVGVVCNSVSLPMNFVTNDPPLTPAERAAEFDRLTALGYKLNFLTGGYYK